MLSRTVNTMLGREKDEIQRLYSAGRRKLCTLQHLEASQSHYNQDDPGATGAGVVLRERSKQKQHSPQKTTADPLAILSFYSICLLHRDNYLLQDTTLLFNI